VLLFIQAQTTFIVLLFSKVDKSNCSSIVSKFESLSIQGQARAS